MVMVCYMYDYEFITSCGLVWLVIYIFGSAYLLLLFVCMSVLAGTLALFIILIYYYSYLAIYTSVLLWFGRYLYIVAATISHITGS